MRKVTIMRKATILAMAVLLVGLLAAPATAGGPNKTAIAGTATLEILEPAEVWFTPGGVMHETGALGLTVMAGDLEGMDYLDYRGTSTMTADMSVYVVRCASSGELIWNGRTGPFTGTTFAKCELAGDLFACTGHSTYHGSGELDGVTFRINWDGVFGTVGEFTYEGFAVDAHG